MKNCPVCGSIPAHHTNETNNQDSDPIYVLSDHLLLQRERYQNMARYVAALPMASREIPDWMAEKIFWFEGKILWPNGQKFNVGDDDIDLAFNDEQSFRWIRSFRNHAEVPLRQRPQSRLATRLRLIALAIQIDLRNLGQQ